MEIELKKCNFGGSPQHLLVYFRLPSPDEQVIYIFLKFENCVIFINGGDA